MKKINDGYSAGKKQWAEMCAEGGRVAVKGYSRGGAVKKAFPKAPPKPTPTSKDTPKLVTTTAKAKGGKVMKKADGGAVKKPDDDSFLDKKRTWITDDRKPGENFSIQETGQEIKKAAKDVYKASKDLVGPGDKEKALSEKMFGHARGGKVKSKKGKR